MYLSISEADSTFIHLYMIDKFQCRIINTTSFQTDFKEHGSGI